MNHKPLKDLIVGALVGIISMLPGASGATIAVIFGVYERLVADLASIREKLFHDLRFIVPFGFGVVIGLFVCAKGLDALMERWEIPMMFFFATLILAQIPDVRDMGNDGTPMTVYNWIAIIVGMAIMFFFLYLGLTNGDETVKDGGFVIWVAVGAILAISKLAPGISGSSVLIAIGLFTPLTAAMSDFEMSVLIPVAIGILLGVLVFARIVDYFMTRNRKSTYMVILGLTIGSVITVALEAAVKVDGTSMIIECVVCAILGIVLGYALSIVSKKYAKETIDSEPEEE